MVPDDEADRGRPALQVQGRDFGGMRHRRRLRNDAGLSLLLQGRAGLEHLPRLEERRRERRADVFWLLERMVARSLAADRRRLADCCPLNRQGGIKRACFTSPGEMPGGDVIYPERRSGTSAVPV